MTIYKYLIISWQKLGFKGYKMLLHERDTYEAPHGGFITSILHKVNQLSKMKIKLFKCYLDV